MSNEFLWDKLWYTKETQFLSLGPSFYHKSRWVSRLWAEVSHGNNLIDIACGSGDYYDVLLQQFKKVTGFDHSQNVIKLISLKYPKLVFQYCDIENGIAVEEKVDAVTCLNALEEMKDDRSALINMIALLKKGGHLMLLVPHGKRYWGPKDKLAGNVRRYEKEELEKMVSALGCELVRTVIWGFPVYRIWYWLLNRVKQEQVWEKKGLSILSLVAARFASYVLYIDDLFQGSRYGSFMLLLAKKK